MQGAFRMTVPPHTAGSSHASDGDPLVFMLLYMEFYTAFLEATSESVTPRKKPLSLKPFRERGFDDWYLQWMLFQGHIEHLQPFPNPAEEPVTSLLLDDAS